MRLRVRCIMHVDMDAFFAAVEQADHPELRGMPVIVGASRRGVVSAASYEARKYGVRSAMPVFQARRLCPKGIFLPVRMSRYKEVSRQVMELLTPVAPLVEQVSIDEAFVDLTGTESLHGSPEALACRLKEDVRRRTSLTCSIGVAPNKFLAKIASDMRKPDGLTILDEGQVQAFMSTLPVGRSPGIGAKTLQSLRGLGVVTASDVLRFPPGFWMKRLGKGGLVLYERAQGLDPSPVVPHAEPKSISAEDTFESDTSDRGTMAKWLLRQAESVGRELREGGFKGRTVTLKVKTSDFKLITRSRTLREPTDSTQILFSTVLRLLEDVGFAGSVRLVGVGVSNLCCGVGQTRLFPDPRNGRAGDLDRAIDRIRTRFGEQALVRGRAFEPPSEREHTRSGRGPLRE